MGRYLALMAVVVAAVAVAAGYIYMSGMLSERTFRGQELTTPLQAYDFTLIDQYGNKVSLSDFRGKVIAVSFVYTHCPDICPRIVLEMAKAYTELEKIGLTDEVVFVLVSVDPERDTPEQFREWSKALNAEEFVYLTGSYEDVSRVWKNYGIYVEKQNMTGGMPSGHGEHTGYIVSHTPVVYLIDRDFKMRIIFAGVPPDWSYQDLVNDIELLLG